MGICLVVLERKEPQASHFWVQSKLKCFLVLPAEVLRKHNHCQSPLQRQSSPLCKVQACCFTRLPVCLVTVRLHRQPSSPKSIAEVLFAFLVTLLQRPPALQRGQSDEGSHTVRWDGSALQYGCYHRTPCQCIRAPR